MAHCDSMLDINRSGVKQHKYGLEFNLSTPISSCMLAALEVTNKTEKISLLLYVQSPSGQVVLLNLSLSPPFPSPDDQILSYSLSGAFSFP